jgi:hypothetical protein
MKRIPCSGATVAMLASSNDCASTCGGMTSVIKLGAAEYRPAALVPPDRQASYEGMLSACRQAGFNRQITSAHKARQDTLIGAVTGAADGAASSFQVDSTFSRPGSTPRARAARCRAAPSACSPAWRARRHRLPAGRGLHRPRQAERPEPGAQPGPGRRR